jgi:membrane complex biogenesis BtpA family protein
MARNGFLLKEIFTKPKPIIGMVHLRALPGSPLYNSAAGMNKIVGIAVEEARKLEAAGVDGVQVENIWDFPYLKGTDIGMETVAAMAVVASKVKDAVKIPIGINCHLNGGMQALAVAQSVGAQWIRVFEWVNAYVSHVGITEGIGGQLARYRSYLHAENIRFFCDVNVKHGSHFIISDRSIAEQAHDAESQGAEALIVTGFETGKAPTADKVREFKDSVNTPVLVGSGITAENAAELLQYADGAIVGSYFKTNNNWKNPVDGQKARTFMDSVERLRRSLGDD